MTAEISASKRKCITGMLRPGNNYDAIAFSLDSIFQMKKTLSGSVAFVGFVGTVGAKHDRRDFWFKA